MTRAILWPAFLLCIAYCLLQPAYPDAALLVGLASLGLFVWGCARYAREKGHPAWLGGMLGILNVVGLLILAATPPAKEPDDGKHLAAHG